MFFFSNPPSEIWSHRSKHTQAKTKKEAKHYRKAHRYPRWAMTKLIINDDKLSMTLTALPCPAMPDIMGTLTVPSVPNLPQPTSYLGHLEWFSLLRSPLEPKAPRCSTWQGDDHLLGHHSLSLSLVLTVSVLRSALTLALFLWVTPQRSLPIPGPWTLSARSNQGSGAHSSQIRWTFTPLRNGERGAGRERDGEEEGEMERKREMEKKRERWRGRGREERKRERCRGR